MEDNNNLIQQMNCRTLVIAHTLELIQQSKDKILMISPDLDVGIVNADCKGFSKQIVVCTIQSARHPENLEKLASQNFQLCIYDEAHHCSSDSARHVLDTLGFGKGTKKLLVGFTATPSRNDSRGIGEDFDEIVYSKDTRWMIENEYLCPPKGIKIATDLDLSTVKIDDSDFSQNALAKVMDTPPINDLVVKTYKEKALDRKTICFSVSVEHAHNLKDHFRKEGITSEAISRSTPKKTNF
jgi:superfamily II DNA or RNA helicase